MFNIVKKEINWEGKKLILETGRIARQANGAVLATLGETTVLCTATAATKAKEGIDFFPLTVNYIEKYYAAGKIPGGFFKREGRSTEKETLTSRLIDRPIRPMFDDNYRNETQVICTVLSFDKENDSDIVALIGASAALTISEIPFLGPIAASKVGLIDGKLVANPTISELANSDLDLTVSGTADSLLMIESQANNLSEKQMLEALSFGQKSYQPVIKAINEMAKEVGKEKWEVPEADKEAEDLFKKIEKKYAKDITKAYEITDKQDRSGSLSEIKEKILAEFDNEEGEFTDKIVAQTKKLEKKIVRSNIFEDKRIDGRKTDEIRKISVETGFLPRVHGSALFTRGETQSLTVVTLGGADDEQMIDSLEGNFNENFMLHYNFPPFSVGEVGMLRAPGRREVGHGKLAKKAVEPIIPESTEFPYTIRIVSEITESNGSSSMATVCASSLALMDAGVPVENPVAGIAMGLVLDGKKFKVLSDILGDEDHLGDMDFKVAGSKDGINALQMDIKVKGITNEIFENAIKQATKGKAHILGEMAKVIKTHNTELGDHAPVMETTKVKEDKIREVIGQGGKVIKGLCEETNCKISIEDDGTVKICAPDKASGKAALDAIAAIVEEPEIGKTYKGTVQKITDYGAFVGFLNNQSGLIHISEFTDGRISSVEQFLSEGDEISFKVIGMDGNKLRLSYKAANDSLPKEKEGYKPKKSSERDSKSNRGSSNKSSYKGKKGDNKGNRKGKNRRDRDNDDDDNDDKGGTPPKKKKGFFW